jgi:pyridoxal phosphate enzyme (YggS family)
MSIAANIERIEERILHACSVSGRNRGEITLLCVSKFQGLPTIEQAWNTGIRLFGESRVGEGLEKFSVFRDNHSIEGVHLIGNLQRNKVKAAVGFFDCIQSVDRIELIHELGKFASARSEPLEILFELHTGEESKNGFPDIDSLCGATEYALNCRNLAIRGLMTMAPFTGDPHLIRASFRQLSRAREVLERHFPSESYCSWSCLSMGMSADYEIAIEEGSTMLRIGGAIFANSQERNENGT